ncbi:hypothetical protein AAFF27_18830 [Xylophilus sp. GW821-FHT01B05]
MPFISSLPPGASPLAIYKAYPDIYGPWSQMSEAIMNGDSAFSQAERELLFAYAAGAAGCDFVCVAHSEVAYARGVPHGTVEALLKDPATAGIDAPLRPVVDYIQLLMTQPHAVTQAHVDAIVSAGWDERALNDVVAIAGRAAFMQRIVAGYGLVPMGREIAAEHAQRRIALGYVNVVNGKP